MRSEITIDDDSEAPPAASAAGARPTDEPVVIEARGLAKSFRIPEHRIDSLKERAAHPFARMHYRQLHALQEMSFDIHRGEFFGIVGRNGSGKSTLLKILASIYRPDTGRVRMAGRVAPFIELGVGFNPDLTARENGELNGVLMGLSRREARARLDAVLEFAELEDFVELKLKNYSSGMMVRLAFAVMVQADADIMLIDEVLAVGDAAFGQKCMDVFHERRRSGKTVVLVTHDMSTVQEMCHRALLIHDGEMKYVGDPEETARRYFRLNFARPADGDEGPDRTAVPDFNARLVHARLENQAGDQIDNVEQGEPIVLDAMIEARRELEDPKFVVQVQNEDSIVVFGFTRTLEEGQSARIDAGQRVRLSGEIENRLVPGHYSVDCWVRQDRSGGDMAVQGLRLLDFVVYGTGSRAGIFSVQADFDAALEPDPGP